MQDAFLVRFAEITDRSAAEELAKADLFIEAGDRRQLAAGEFWPDELIGLEARSPTGDLLGRVVEVEDAVPQARLVVETASGPRLIPLVNELVPEIRADEGYLVLTPIPGLLDD
jgi:16S rRNA processing protein RimM